MVYQATMDVFSTRPCHDGCLPCPSPPFDHVFVKWYSLRDREQQEQKEKKRIAVAAERGGCE